MANNEALKYLEFFLLTAYLILFCLRIRFLTTFIVFKFMYTIYQLNSCISLKLVLYSSNISQWLIRPHLVCNTASKVYVSNLHYVLFNEKIWQDQEYIDYMDFKVPTTVPQIMKSTQSIPKQNCPN